MGEGAMRKVLRGLVLAGSLALAGFATAPAEARQGPESVADLAEGLTDAVVNISTAQRVGGGRRVPLPQVPPGSPFEEFFDEFFKERGEEQPRRVNSLGSGFVIDPSGLIVTNNHVIADADEIKANFADGTELVAEVVGRDPKTDLALLKVEPAAPLKALRFGDSNGMRVGDWVMAIGNPFGLGGTVTVGIVSAINRDIGSGPYDAFIQTDASINRGNSGGPLFNEAGEVIGINTAIISPTGGSIGIGFAIPAALATKVLTQLQEFGEARRGWLGVRIQSVTEDIAESLGIDSARGALIAGVTPEGPASAAGLEPGDVVISFDGKPVADMRDLPRIVADTEIGRTVDVQILRKGEERTVQAVVGQLPEDEAAGPTLPESGEEAPGATGVLGLTLAEMTPALRDQFGIGGSVEGVVVTDVEEGSAAAEKRIARGEVIVEVAQEKVSTPEEVVARVEDLLGQGRRSVLMLIANPQGELRFVPVPVDDTNR
jgi:serine protease Do